MSRTVYFRPEAEAEALDSQRWYEHRRPGLGAEFGEAISGAVTRVADNPVAFQKVHGETRRAVLRRFPYAIYFRVDRDDIIVLAVHGRQHEARWQSRR